MKTMLLMCAAAVAIASACAAQAQQAPVPGHVKAALASTDRPQDDTARDALRKPGELVGFAGIEPGYQVADIIPGKGYFTRIFSKVVGPQGRVFAVVPEELVRNSPKAADAVKALAAETAFSNVVAQVAPIAQISAPGSLDAAWTSNNYHDIYGAFGAAQAAELDAAVFKALKPGGIFIVIDHAAKPGTSDTSAKTLHRIDPETVKAQALAAGFTLEAESPVLRNADDPRDAAVFSPAIRGHSDQFVLKFRKPRG